MAYTITKIDYLHEGWSRLLRAEIRAPSGAAFGREILERSAAAAVLPYDPERRVALLVRQFRAPLLHAAGRPDLTEAIAGVLDGEDPQACARREALEEAGLRLGNLEGVGAVWPSPGLSTETIHLFLAEYAPADRVAEGGGLASENEDITVLEVPLANLPAGLDGGAPMDLKTLALVQALRLRRPDLF